MHSSQYSTVMIFNIIVDKQSSLLGIVWYLTYKGYPERYSCKTDSLLELIELQVVVFGGSSYYRNQIKLLACERLFLSYQKQRNYWSQTNNLRWFLWKEDVPFFYVALSRVGYHGKIDFLVVLYYLFIKRHVETVAASPSYGTIWFDIIHNLHSFYNSQIEMLPLVNSSYNQSLSVFMAQANSLIFQKRIAWASRLLKFQQANCLNVNMANSNADFK